MFVPKKMCEKTKLRKKLIQFMCTDLELGPRVCSWGRPLGGCAEERATADTFKAAAARASACAPNRWASDPSRQL